MGVGSAKDHGFGRVHPTDRHGISPAGVLAQELCRHLQRCLKHEDVSRQVTLRGLNLACAQWACNSLRELTEEMEMWKWDSTLDNKWARVAKCSQLLSIPVEMPGARRAARYELGEGNTRTKATEAQD